MRERSLKRTSVLLAVLFGLVAALTGFALFFGGSSTHASADEGTTSLGEVLYFVDAGRFVLNPGEEETLSVRTGTKSYPGKKASPFMTANGLSFGDGEGHGLYNSVTDKPSVDHDFSEGDYSYVSTFADPVTHKNWGFDVINNNADGEPESKLINNCQDGYPYSWNCWRTWGVRSNSTGFETIRYIQGLADSNWEGSLVYTFEVDDDTTPLYLRFGATADCDNWGDMWFDVDVNGAGTWASYKAQQNGTDTYYWGHDIYGVKNPADNKYYVTVTFGRANQQPFISYILLAKDSVVDYEQEASYIQNSGSATVGLLPKTLIPGNVNHSYYVQGTIDQASIDAINAATPFTYVNNVTVTTPGGQETTANILALPSATTYFVNAGYDAAYNAEHGYGYSACVGANVRSGLENPYKTSLRYTGGKITYKFDAPAGIYTVAVASKDPWWPNNDRKIAVTLNGETKEQLSAGASNAAEPNIGSYIVNVNDTNGITLELAAPNGVSGADPVLSYIWVYEMEAVITYDANGGSAIAPAVRTKGSSDAVTVTSEEPTYTGYAFLGWYTQATGGDKVEAGAEYTSATTLYAHWEETSPRNVTFKLDATDANAYATVTGVPYGTVIAAGDRPTVPTKEGYYFAGWFNGETEFDPATGLVKSDLTLIAHWNVDPLAQEDDYTKAEEEGAATWTLISEWYGNLNHDGKKLYVPVGEKAVAVYTVEGGTNHNAGVVLSFLYGGTRYNCGPLSVYCFNNATDTAPGNWGSSHDGATATAIGNGNITVSVNRSSTHGSIYGNANKKITQYALVELLDSTHITYTVKTYDTDALPFKDVLCETVFNITLPNAISEFDFFFAFDKDGSDDAAATFKTASVKYVTLNNTVFTLTFDENNGSGATPAEFKQRGGTVYNVQYTPRTGYNFRGWQYDGDQLLQPGDLTVTRNYAFTAQWEAKTYTLTYDVNGGNALTSTSKTVTYDTAVGTLPTPTRTGYTFAGWFTQASGGTQVTKDTIWTTDADTPIYAQWTAKQYTLTLHAGEGTVTPTTYQVTYDVAVGELPEPELTGYTFGGWYTAATDGTKIESDTVWSYTNVTELYAKWTAKEYTITWNANGGTLADGTTATTITFGENLTLPDDPTNGEQVFIGWNTESDGTGASVDAGTLTVDLGDSTVTVYAQWASDGAMIRTVSYDLNYDGASNTIPNKKVVVNGTIAVLPTPTRTGYTFGGWYKEAACETEFVAGETQVEDDLTLYAKWTARKYTLTLNAGDGTVTPGTYQVTYGAAVGELPTPTLTGYTFTGWYTATTDGTKIESDTVWNSTTVLTLYARWTLTEYTVTFDSQGGSTVVAATAHYDETINAPTDPTRDGYTFGGWYKEAACTNAWDFANDTVTDNITLYAKWTAVTPPPATTYTVTFDAQGGSSVNAITNVTSGSTITEPTAPTKEGYTFGGWYTDANCTTAWNFATDTVTDNITLYAKWTENSTPTPTPTPAPSGDSGKKGGCGSSVMAETSAIIAALMLALAGVIVLKKKAENK